LETASLKDLICSNAQESWNEAVKIIHGEEGPKTDLVLLNTGFAFKTADRTESVLQGMELARKLIAEGAVVQKIDQIKKFFAS
jgi:anthranilate phosphoribosyltransferase